MLLTGINCVCALLLTGINCVCASLLTGINCVCASLLTGIITAYDYINMKLILICKPVNKAIYIILCFNSLFSCNVWQIARFGTANMERSSCVRHSILVFVMTVQVQVKNLGARMSTSNFGHPTNRISL